MSEEEIINNLSSSENIKNEEIAVEEKKISDENNSANNVYDSGKKQKTKKYHAPLYIAACIFLASILIFSSFLCFFNTDINGTWGLRIKGADGNKDLVFNLSFDDTVARLQSAGTVYIGRLSIKDENGEPLRDDSGNPLMSISMNLNGNPFVFKFNYFFSGNIITGRTLKLTDLSGMFLEPDNEKTDKEEVQKHKKNNEYIEKDKTVYYIWSLTPSVEKFDIKKEKNFKPDNKLLGSWLLKRDDDAYPYTLTFNKDGTFEQLAYEMEVYGVYTVDKGKLTLKFVQLGNNDSETTFDYSVDNKKLNLKQEYNGTALFNIELKKTNDKYSFKSEIK